MVTKMTTDSSTRRGTGTNPNATQRTTRTGAQQCRTATSAHLHQAQRRKRRGGRAPRHVDQLKLDARERPLQPLHQLLRVRGRRHAVAHADGATEGRDLHLGARGGQLLGQARPLPGHGLELVALRDEVVRERQPQLRQPLDQRAVGAVVGGEGVAAGEAAAAGRAGGGGGEEGGEAEEEGEGEEEGRGAAGAPPLLPLLLMGAGGLLLLVVLLLLPAWCC